MSHPVPPDDPAAAGPGVRVPPPLIYLVGFAIGWLLDRAHPLPIRANPDRLDTFGGFWCGAGIAIAVLAFLRFGQARTTVLPHRPASTLVTTGVYRLTRNPMYVSLLLLYLGAALVVRTWWPLLVLPLVLLVVDRLVIAREERHLRAKFGEEYETYRRRVRRWI